MDAWNERNARDTTRRCSFSVRCSLRCAWLRTGARLEIRRSNVCAWGDRKGDGVRDLWRKSKRLCLQPCIHVLVAVAVAVAVDVAADNIVAFEP